MHEVSLAFFWHHHQPYYPDDVAGENPGDELAYLVDGTTRQISWYDASEDETAVIEWDALTRVGSIMVPGYNSGALSCWDGGLQNVACP